MNVLKWTNRLVTASTLAAALAIALAAGELAVGTDVVVLVRESRVLDRSMEGCPHDKKSDPYLHTRLFTQISPTVGNEKYVWTSTEWEQDVGNRPFENRLLEFCNLPPPQAGTLRLLKWNIIDDDTGNADDKMTTGLAHLPPGRTWQKSESNHHRIRHETLNPGICQFRFRRVLPPAALVAEPIEVILTLQGTEPGDMTLFEQMPVGFEFLTADPPPAIVESPTGGIDEEGGTELAGTLVSWDVSDPAGGTPFTFRYTVQTPAVMEDLRQPFGQMIVQGETMVSSAVPLEELVIGGVLEDCNEDGIDDFVQVAAANLPDCNANLIPDSCDIASGASMDENMDGIPDECTGDREPPGGPIAEASGDVNGDGDRDISDAVYLLEWLFLGGPEPVPAVCNP